MRRFLVLGAVAVATSLLMACGWHRGVDAGTPPEVAVPGPTLTGNYLAARHARAEGADGDAATFLLAALRRSPDDAVLLNRAYVALVLDGRVGEAVDVATRALAAQPDAPLPHIVLAVDDLHAGRYQQASSRLASAPQSPFSSFLVPVLKAWAEFGRGDRAAALASLEPLRTNTQVAALYDVHAAWLGAAAGDAGAAALARTAVERHSEVWLRLAELAGGIYERAGQGEDAEALYRRYLQRHPDSQLLDGALARLKAGQRPALEIASARDGAAEALFDAAGVLGRQNNRDTALLLGRLGLHLRPNFPALQVLVGDMLENDEQYAAANRLYAAIDPAAALKPTAQIAIARNLDRMERPDEAEAMLRRLAAERASDPDPLTELGDVFRRRERFAEAVEAYDTAIARVGTLEPRHWRLLYVRGIALERSQQWDRAEADFLKALEFEPEQPFVLNYLGYSWVEKGKNLERAETMIRKAVELRPNDGYIVDSLGWVLFRLGRHDEAVTHLERAVELRPEDPVINDHLGDAYWAVGRQREARFQWQAALGLDPEPDLRADIEEKLQRGLVREASADARPR